MQTTFLLIFFISRSERLSQHSTIENYFSEVFKTKASPSIDPPIRKNLEFLCEICQANLVKFLDWQNNHFQEDSRQRRPQP